jgi:hypothetical protein
LGSERIYTLLDGAVSNNLVSIQNTDSEPKGLLHRPCQQLHGLISHDEALRTNTMTWSGITGSPSSICMRSVTLPRSITASPASAQALAA